MSVGLAALLAMAGSLGHAPARLRIGRHRSPSLSRPARIPPSRLRRWLQDLYQLRRHQTASYPNLELARQTRDGPPRRPKQHAAHQRL